jgi:hypothetical protein
MGDERPITKTTRLTANGSTTVVVVPPEPCGLDGCVAELIVSTRSSGMRVHLNDQQRAELIEALGGSR